MSQNPFLPAPVAPTSAPGQPLNDAVARVQDELLHGDPMSVSQGAWEALENATAEHMRSVGVLAVHLARREGLSQVEKTHIDQSHAFIGTRPRASVSVFITSSVGCLVAGIGGSTVGSIIAADPGTPVTDPALLNSLGLTGIGLVLVVISVVITIVTRRRY